VRRILFVVGGVSLLAGSRGQLEVRMRRSVIVLAGFALVSIAAESSVSAQSTSSTASLTITASVAKNCTITTTPVAFGSYDSVTANATTPLDGVGAVIVTCTKGAPAKVGLNDGSNAQGTTRRMSQGAADFLTYELYKDTGHVTRWGNTTDTSLDIPAAPNQTPRSFPVYGRVAPAQAAAVGSYTDTVMATVNF
jgi:spore coat protein U-like protein